MKQNTYGLCIRGDPINRKMTYVILYVAHRNSSLCVFCMFLFAASILPSVTSCLELIFAV